MKHIGMTGTRDGMTEEQKTRFKEYIDEFCKEGLVTHHHGDCIGADEESHDIVVNYGAKTHIHPPENNSLRAYKKGDLSENTKSYFARNRDIVNSSEIVFGFPKLFKETKGGTWYTINYAKDRKVPLVIIWPDGSDTKYNIVA